MPRAARITPAVFAKAELMRIPLWGMVGEALWPDRGRSAIRAPRRCVPCWPPRAAIIRRRAARWSIFPEGTRVPHGSAPELQAGFAGLYKLLGAAGGAGRGRFRAALSPLVEAAGHDHLPDRRGDPAGLPRDEVERRVDAAINALNSAPVRSD